MEVLHRHGWSDAIRRLVQILLCPAVADLVPDQDHTVVTAGFGSPGDFQTRVSKSEFPDCIQNAGWCLRGCLYAHGSGKIAVNMTILKGPASARWFDPTNGVYTSVAGGARSQMWETQQFTPPVAKITTATATGSCCSMPPEEFADGLHSALFLGSAHLAAGGHHRYRHGRCLMFPVPVIFFHFPCLCQAANEQIHPGRRKSIGRGRWARSPGKSAPAVRLRRMPAGERGTPGRKDLICVKKSPPLSAILARERGPRRNRTG